MRDDEHENDGLVVPLEVVRRDVLACGAFAAAAALVPKGVLAQGRGEPMFSDLTESELLSILQLEPNATCGFVRVTFVSKQSIAPGGLAAPFADGGPLGSALYFMVTPTAPVRLHRIRNDQLYHYYLGDPLEVFLLHPNGSHQRVIVGPNIRAGELVQLFIPGNTFHTARIVGGRRWFLGGSTEWPGVVPADVEIGNLGSLAATHADIADDLRDIMASVRPGAVPPGGPR